jgi:hypothetical protein
MAKIRITMTVIFFAFMVVPVLSLIPHLALAAEQASPAAALDEYFWDFGTVKEGDVLNHSFIIKNNTDKMVTVKQINTSCACTTSKLSAWTIEPGKSVTVDVSFNTQGYPGEKHRYTYVHTDDPKRSIIMLEVKANIK